MLEIHDVPQGTQEWHDLRDKYIRTASRTSAVLGISHFSNKEKLIQEIKFGIKPFYSKAMQQGNELEDDVRMMAINYFDDVFEPAVGTNDGLLASLDGINFDGDTIVEIKVSKHTFNALKDGRIPKDYLWQIKHQMAVFDTVKQGFLFAYNPETKETISSEPVLLEDGDKEKINKAWDEFEEFIKTYELPEMDKIEDPEAEALALELFEITTKRKELGEREKELKGKIKDFVTADKTIIGNLTVSHSKGRKSYDYSKIINELKVKDDILEKYVKTSEPSLSFRFSK